MKISSVYLENQIPGNFKKADITEVINSDRFEKKSAEQILKTPKNVVNNNISLKFDEVTQRVLSQSEKKMISDNFGSMNFKFPKVYTRKGESVNMEVMIGKKIDVTG